MIQPQFDFTVWVNPGYNAGDFLDAYNYGLSVLFARCACLEQEKSGEAVSEYGLPL